MNTPHTFYRTSAGSRAFFAGLLAGLFAFSTGAVAADNPVISGSGSATYSYSAPAEFCVMGWETSADTSKWTYRDTLEIQPEHHFLRGDIFVSFVPRDWSDSWFSSGETPSANGYKPASWHSLAGQGPVAYYSGILHPLMQVNVVSRPLNISSLDGGRVVISYGLRENANSSVADSYQEMKNSRSRSNRAGVPVASSSSPDDVRGSFKRYCFIVTGVKKEVACAPGEC